MFLTLLGYILQETQDLCTCSVWRVLSLVSPWQRELSSAQTQTESCLNQSSVTKGVFFQTCSIVALTVFSSKERLKNIGRGRKAPESREGVRRLREGQMTRRIKGRRDGAHQPRAETNDYFCTRLICHILSLISLENCAKTVKIGNACFKKDRIRALNAFFCWSPQQYSQILLKTIL